jgi:hypothetical protein
MPAFDRSSYRNHSNRKRVRKGLLANLRQFRKPHALIDAELCVNENIDDENELMTDPQMWIELDDVEGEMEDDTFNAIYSDMCEECAPSIQTFQKLYRETGLNSNIRGYVTSKRTFFRNQKKKKLLSNVAASFQRIDYFFTQNDEESDEETDEHDDLFKDFEMIYKRRNIHIFIGTRPHTKEH